MAWATSAVKHRFLCCACYCCLRHKAYRSSQTRLVVRLATAYTSRTKSVQQPLRAESCLLLRQLLLRAAELDCRLGELDRGKGADPGTSINTSRQPNICSWDPILARTYSCRRTISCSDPSIAQFAYQFVWRLEPWLHFHCSFLPFALPPLYRPRHATTSLEVK